LNVSLIYSINAMCLCNQVNDNGIPSLQAISETDTDTDLAIQQQLHIKINQLKKKNNSSSKAVSMAKLL